MRLVAGESFEIGDIKYEVVSVNRDEATFAGDNKKFLARPDFASRGKLVETDL